MEHLFGTPENTNSGPVKRLRWALAQKDLNNTPLTNQDSIENLLVRGVLPSLNQLIPCCSQLGLNMDWLFFNQGAPFNADQPDPEIQEMVKFASERKEFRYALLAKFHELRAIYRE